MKTAAEMQHLISSATQPTHPSKKQATPVSPAPIQAAACGAQPGQDKAAPTSAYEAIFRAEQEHQNPPRYNPSFLLATFNRQLKLSKLQNQKQAFLAAKGIKLGPY